MHDESAHLTACIPRLRRHARALLNDRASADELVRETMERAWSRLPSWRNGSDMRIWLFGILHSLHVEQQRKPPPMREPHEEPADAPHGERADILDMRAALRLLPDEQRAVLLLVSLEAMTYEEAAAILHIPAGTVLSRLSRARERLRLLMLGRAPASTLKVVK